VLIVRLGGPADCRLGTVAVRPQGRKRKFGRRHTAIWRFIVSARNGSAMRHRSRKAVRNPR